MPIFNEASWYTDISLDGDIKMYDTSLYKDYLNNFILMVDECDIDCQ